MRWQWASVVAVVTVAALAGIWRVTASRGGCQDASGRPARLDFVLKDMDGRDVSLASFKGRPVLLNFWATWCGPCKEEIPALIELADKYRSRDLVVLGISVDDKPDELKKFAGELKMNYPVLVGLGKDEMLEAYEADAAVPISWFVTPCGTIAGKHPGMASKAYFEQQLQTLF